MTYRIDIKLKGGYGTEFTGMEAPAVLPETGNLTIAYDGGSMTFNRDYVLYVTNEEEKPEPIVLTVPGESSKPRWWNPWSWSFDNP